MNFHLNGIFGWWLRHLLSMCMLFAAGAAALGGGDGGGELDIAGGEGDGGATGGGGEADLGEGGSGEGGGEFEEQLDGEGQGERQSEQQRAAAAQEARLPADVKKLLQDLKASNDPKQIKLADSIRRSLFAAQAWQKVIPGGIRQAREMAQAFEEVGGVDGIRAIQEESQGFQNELAAIDDGWENDPEQFLARAAEEDPETFSRNVPIALEQMRKVDKDGYNYTLSRIFHNTLNSSGVLATMSQLWQLAQANKTAPGMAGVIEGLSVIAEKFNGWAELAQNQPARAPDKGMERLRQKEQEFEKKQQQGFIAEVGRKVRAHMETSIMRDLGKFLAQRKMNIRALRQKDPESFQAMVAEVDRRITDAIRNDKRWLEQKDRLLQSRDEAKVLRFYQQKVDSLLADNNGKAGIARTVAKIFFKPGMAQGGNRQQQGGQRQQNNRQQNSNQGGGDNSQSRVVRLNGQPAGNLIDWSRTTDSMILDGEGYLKGKNELHKWR